MAQWCPVLHSIQGNDPSGPVPIDNTWHIFVTCDDGTSWGHFQSTDVVHWSKQAAAQAPAGGACNVSAWTLAL